MITPDGEVDFWWDVDGTIRDATESGWSTRVWAPEKRFPDSEKNWSTAGASHVGMHKTMCRESRDGIQTTRRRIRTKVACAERRARQGNKIQFCTGEQHVRRTGERTPVASDEKRRPEEGQGK